MVSSMSAIVANAANTAVCSARLCRRFDLASWLDMGKRLNQPYWDHSGGQVRRMMEESTLALNRHMLIRNSASNRSARWMPLSAS